MLRETREADKVEPKVAQQTGFAVATAIPRTALQRQVIPQAEETCTARTALQCGWMKKSAARVWLRVRSRGRELVRVEKVCASISTFQAGVLESPIL